MKVQEKFAQDVGDCINRLRDDTRDPYFLREFIARFAIVWSLVTRIPLPESLRPREMRLPDARDMVAMPVAGGAFGCVATLPALLLTLVLPPAAVAWMACGLYAALGWTLHLDGWGDLWDGIGSGRRGEEMRAVMKDPRTGACGVTGIALAISCRAALLASLPPGDWLSACIVAGGVGRFACTVSACFGTYPWNTGMGREIVDNFRGYQLFCALVTTFVFFPFAPLGWTVGILAASLSGALLALWANKNLGGTNGDVLGASSVLGEILVLACCAL